MSHVAGLLFLPAFSCHKKKENRTVSKELQESQLGLVYDPVLPSRHMHNFTSYGMTNKIKIFRSFLVALFELTNAY